MIDEQRYRSLIQQLATGGITGNNNNYMNGGGVGSMMQPKRGLVNGPGGYAGLGYQEEIIEDGEILQENLMPSGRVRAGFRGATGNANERDNSIINAATELAPFNNGVVTYDQNTGKIPESYRDQILGMVEPDMSFTRDYSNFDDARMGNANQIPDRNRGQVIERNPSAPFNRGFTMADVANTATGPFTRDFSSFDEARMGAPANSSLGYQDGIMGMVGNDPFAGMNALEKDIAKQAMNTSQAEFDGDFNSEFYNDNGIYTKQKGEPILAENRKNPLKNFFNKDTNVFGYQKKPTGPMTGIMDFMGKLPTPLNLVRNMMNRDPNAPSYKTYSPNIDYSNLNTNNLNDFYDDNPESETYGTTRFDRAKPGSFASFRTLKDYFNRNKKKAEKIGITKVAAETKQTELDRRQAIADAQAARGQTTSGGAGNYRSDRDNSRAGGYGGSGRASRENRSSDLGFSDIRLKDNIELVGKSPSDINIYNFTYLNDPKVYQGVMAQEVPWASVKHDSGYLMVDYNKVDVDFKSV